MSQHRLNLFIQPEHAKRQSPSELIRLNKKRNAKPPKSGSKISEADEKCAQHKNTKRRAA